MGNYKGKHKKNPVVKRVLRGVYNSDGDNDADDHQGNGIKRLARYNQPERPDRDRNRRRC